MQCPVCDNDDCFFSAPHALYCNQCAVTLPLSPGLSAAHVDLAHWLEHLRVMRWKYQQDEQNRIEEAHRRRKKEGE